MKKFLTLLLTITFMLSLVGCASKKTAKDGKTDATPTLVWLVPGDKQADTAKVMEEVNKLIEPKIGAKLDLQFVDTGAYSEKMTVYMASGNEYDLCFTGFVNNYHAAATKGGLYDMTELLNDTPTLKKSLPDYIWDVAKIEDEIYAVPNLQMIAQQLCLIIKKDLADKYDLDTDSITSTEDIEPFLEKVKNGEKNIFPFRPNYGIGSFQSMDKEKTSEEIISGITVSKKGDKLVVSSSYNKENREIAAKLHEWFEKGYIRSDVASVMDDSQDVNAGKYAVQIGSYAPGGEKALSQAYGWDVLAIPISKPYITMNSGRETLTGISTKSKHPELAMKLIELLNTDKEIYNMISYGIEGVHYNKIDETHISLIDGSAYAPNASWKFGNTFNGYLLDDQEADIYEQSIAINESATRSSLTGFVLNTDKIRTEISQLETVRGEYKVINNGSMSPDEYYDSFLKELNEGGINRVIEEAQKQIDKFLKKN